MENDLTQRSFPAIVAIKIRNNKPFLPLQFVKAEAINHNIMGVIPG